jgi:hypothetical protein
MSVYSGWQTGLEVQEFRMGLEHGWCWSASYGIPAIAPVSPQRRLGHSDRQQMHSQTKGLIGSHEITYPARERFFPSVNQ